MPKWIIGTGGIQNEARQQDFCQTLTGLETQLAGANINQTCPEDLVVDTELLESARDAGYATKVVFISTEDPNLNVGRILIRMGHRGQSVPLAAIRESYERSMKSLREAREHADDVLVYDNTPDAKGHRLVARFFAGELVKTTHSSPEWLNSVFGRGFDGERRKRERPTRGR